MSQQDIIKAIGEMSIVELNDLVKAIEEEFGIEAVAAVAGPAADAAPAADAKVTVTLTSGSGVPVIKVVKDIMGLGLGESKALVDGTPSVLKENIDRAEAEEIKEKLEAAGASVEIA